MSDHPLPDPAPRTAAAAAAAGTTAAVATDRHYGLDIETDTTVDGLDPSTSSIVAVAVSTPRRDHVLTGSEPQVLAQLETLLCQLPPGVLVTWNGSSFDLPFLEYRARLVGVPLGLRLWPAGTAGIDQLWPPPAHGFRGSWGPHRHLDGFRLFRSDVRRTLGLSCGLKAMARLVGLPVVEVDRTGIHQLSAHELESYVASDARLARLLVGRRMPSAAASVDRVPLPVATTAPVGHADPVTPPAG